MKAFQFAPARFDDGRREAIEEGARAAGYDVVDARGMQCVPGRPGDILMTWNRHASHEPTYSAFEAQGGRLVVFEEAYTRRLWPVKHFAVSLDGHNGSGTWHPGGASRWRTLGLQVQPWRVDGDHVLVCGQRGIGSPEMRSPPGWHEDVARRLKKWTDRPIIVRPHPGKNKASAPPLEDQLQNCWCVVVWSSAVAVQALVAGIPVIVEAPHHILDGAVLRGISRVERPTFTNREDALERMAWAQWTMDEILAGAPFRHLCPRR